MTLKKMVELVQLVKQHEGFRAHPYRDTMGKLTIGYGTNLDEGLSEKEALLLLSARLNQAIVELRNKFGWWDQLPEQAQIALADMAYNLGLPRLLTFRRMLRALAIGDYEEAAREALDSKWARQVGNRAETVADLLRQASQ